MLAETDTDTDTESDDFLSLDEICLFHGMS